MQTASSETAPTSADLDVQTRIFLREVISGLRQPQKRIPSKYFYDAEGSRLFDEITHLDEYYPTRTEVAIMKRHIAAITECLGARCLLVEYGSGSSIKTKILLDHLENPAGYVPIDISCVHLEQAAEALSAAYPSIPVLPVCADYTRSFALPEPPSRARHTVVFFPGSTIGNFEPTMASSFLSHVATVAGPNGGLLIGVDLKKDVRTLEAAYNDARGITAAFNRNVLGRINRELRANFRLDHFDHRAFYNEAEGRIEMHLVSLKDQQVEVGGNTIAFRQYETIHTENSYKYGLDEFAALAGEAGFSVVKVWTDEDQLFSVQYLEVR